MGSYIDSEKNKYIGKRFNRLIVLDVLPDGLFNCKCDCGTEKIIAKYHVIHNNTKSCGCLKLEIDSKKTTLKTQNRDKMILHNNWLLMKFKCSNPKAKTYKLYGARGIKVCEEWVNDYIAFYDWSMANGWKSKSIISLIDKTKDFSTNNVRYVDRSDTQYSLEYDGVNLTYVEWAKKLNLSVNTLYRRKKLGYDNKSILFGDDKKIPTFSNKRNLTYNNITLTVNEWAEKTGLTTQCINYRLAGNWSIEQTLETPLLVGKQKVTKTILKITCNGETKSLAEWEKISNVNKKIIHIRYYNLKWSAEKAIFTPVRSTLIINKVLNYNGIKQTIGEWAVTLNKTPRQINDRILKGWSIKDALFLPNGIYRKKNTYNITCRGETKTIDEWSSLSNVKKEIIYTRLHRLKWDEESSIFTPVGKQRMITKSLTYKGQTKTLEEWSKIYNINIRRLNARLEKGWTAEQILLTPYKKRRINRD